MQVVRSAPNIPVLPEPGPVNPDTVATPDCAIVPGLVSLMVPPHGQWSCSGCRATKLPLGMQLYGCRKCDYDLCPPCYAAQQDRTCVRHLMPPVSQFLTPFPLYEVVSVPRCGLLYTCHTIVRVLFKLTNLFGTTGGRRAVLRRCRCWRSLSGARIGCAPPWNPPQQRPRRR